MVTTNDPTIAERVRLLRNHGMRERYVHEILGFNMRMMDLQAAIGRAQLAKLDKFNMARQRNAAYLTGALQGVPGVAVPQIRPGAEHVFHQYTIRVQDRAAMAEWLRQANVGFGIHYPKLIYHQRPFQGLRYDLRLPVAEECANSVLSLPVHPDLSQAQLDTVVRVVCSAATERTIPELAGETT